RIGRQLNFHGELFQRFAVNGQSIGRNAARQIASVKRVSAFGTGQTRGRENEIEMRTGANGEAVEVFVSTAVNKVADTEDEPPVGGRDEIEQAAAPLAFEFPAASIIDNQRVL